MAGDCYCLRTFREGDLEGAANVNVVTCSRLNNLVDGTDGLRYHASIPLYAPNNKMLGVLNVASTDWRELSPDDLRLLYTVGDMLSIAIERARLFERSTQVGAVEERNRLAREIHDTIAQGLAAISLQLESAEALMESGANSERIHKAIGQALDLTRDNLEEARRSVMDLRAAPLEGRTLAEALSVLANDCESNEGLKVKVDITGGNRPLSPRIESGLYRIVQEAMTNTIRHAEANNVNLRLLTTPNEIRLTIEDNGRGFDVDDVSDERFGLMGLNERAKLLGGMLKLESSPGIGTRIEVSILVSPLPKPTSENS